MPLNRNHFPDGQPTMADQGGEPFIVNLKEACLNNPYYRIALWTGQNLQLTLMTIPPEGEIGLEVHPDVDQFLYIEGGTGIVKMGDQEQNLYFRRQVFKDSGIFIPAGTWHNVINNSPVVLSLFTIYAPPQHPFGTIHPTILDAQD